MQIIRVLKVGFVVATLLYVGSSAPKSVCFSAGLVGVWAVVWGAEQWIKHRHRHLLIIVECALMLSLATLASNLLGWFLAALGCGALTITHLLHRCERRQIRYTIAQDMITAVTSVQQQREVQQADRRLNPR
ncbi:MAG: hypothetical protein MI924_00240 [Chloroflexales bacterium]|nr:hypothetical protein [Chloroflexales bacterium]